MEQEFRNSQQRLDRDAPQVIEQRRRLGLEGLVGPLAAVTINTEADLIQPTVAELLRYTGMEVVESFQDDAGPTCVLRTPFRPAWPDVLVHARRRAVNPFAPFVGPKSQHLPSTRLETFIFETPDLEKYVRIQRRQGVEFLSDIVRTSSYLFIQTMPSRHTGNSIGLIQWLGTPRQYACDAHPIAWPDAKPVTPYLQNIRHLDHVATRLTAQDRDDAILEFMALTNYNFSFAYFVESLNSITSVARRGKNEFAMVFTSGIAPYQGPEHSGPTETFVHNYGPRPHHMAFTTEYIEYTVESLR